MDVLIKRYAPTLLPLLVMVGGVFTATGDASVATLTDWRTLAQIGILLATTGATYVFGLLPTGWRGAWKVSAPIVGAVLSFLLATIGTDWHPSKANIILVVVGVLKIVATQLGVSIRTEPVKTIDATGTLAGTAPVVTALGVTDALVDGDGLSDPRNTAAADEPRHLAKS